MLLKSIKIQGFKSFADKTGLQFGSGITAVVGPNGSGKSNISDAVRWVLGEQSTKSLRGSSMEDVIFDGSDARRPQGFAEVTLTIDNTDRSLNFDNDTVFVTRRYYRSHESEYLLNGASVRLKDINELFMDTGLGRDGYSMIGQGKIDSIVGAKPNERRDIFEEASGISRYRYRKTEAEKKLTAAEENMERLRDIFAELEGRIGPLKKQSEKAEKYLKLRDERKELEIGLWLHALDTSKDTLREHDRKMTAVRRQYDETETELSKMAESQEEAHRKNAEFISAIEEKRNFSAELLEKAAKTEGEIAVDDNTVEHNNSNIERITLEIEGLRGSDDAAKENIENEEKRLADADEAVKSAEETVQKLTEELNRIVTESEGVSKKSEEIALKINALMRDSSDAEVKLAATEISVKEIEERLNNIELSKEELKAKYDKLLEETKVTQEERENLEESVKSYDNTLKGYEMRLVSREEAVEKAMREADKLLAELRDTERKIELLEELERSMEGFNHAVKTVITDGKRGALKGIKGPVARLIKSPDEYAVAIETALGSASQNIIVETENDAKRAINLLKSEKAGRATFLPVSTIVGKKLDEKEFSSLYGFVGIASDLIECDKEYREIAKSLLGRIIVAEDLDSAVSIANKTGYKHKVVSLDGQQVAAGGALTGGSLSKNAGLLSRAVEIANLKKSRENLALAVKSAESERDNLKSGVEAVEKDVANIEAERKTANEDLIRILGELKRLEELLNSVGGDMTALENEEKLLVARKENEIQSSTEYKELKEKSDAQKERLTEELDTISGGRDELSERRETAGASLTEAKLKVVELNSTREIVRRSLERLKADSRDREYRASQLELQKLQLVEMNENVRAHTARLKQEVENFKTESENALKDAENLRTEREKAEKENVEAHKKERELLDNKEKLGGELVRLSERRSVMESEYDNIVGKLFDEYELTRSEAEELKIEIENPADAKRELQEVKNKMRALGDVNVGAIDEYREVSERYEFYKVQIEDVEKSKKELTKLIGELTGTMRDLFRDGFNKINRNFGKTFTDLFGGGSAELVLSDPDDILESGIDIAVRIPGKTVSKIELLSGGEKALVAISIYFAIMTVNPPPFCILDEVESALDDVNVTRVADYMHHMNDSTQFICITHRRGTMEAADMLYGVTMQEKGVSRLLELNVTELEKKLGIEN